MIITKNLNEARKGIQKLVKDENYVVVRAQDDNFNRKILENKDVDMIVGLEMHSRKDYMKQRDSGLNEILCKLAEKNDIKIGVEVEVIARLGKVEKARVLARVAQNIVLCRRVGVEIVLLGEIGKQKKRSFMSVLGASTKQ